MLSAPGIAALQPVAERGARQDAATLRPVGSVGAHGAPDTLASATELTLVEHLGEGVLLTDLGDTVLYANAQILELTGYTLAEMLGRPAYTLLLPEAQWPDIRAHNRNRYRGKTERYEVELQRKDGSRFWAEVTGTPRRDAAGEVVGTLGVVSDVSERKAAEAQLQQQNAYLAALHETSLGLMRRLELGELLETIVARATDLAQAAHGFVYLVGEDGRSMKIMAGVGLFASYRELDLRPGQGVAGHVWATGEPLAVQDYALWPERVGDRHLAAVKTVVGVPLRSDPRSDRVTGVIGVAYDRSAPTTAQTTELLGSFAKLAAIALDNARLYSHAQSELQARVRKEARLLESEQRHRELFLEARQQAKELQLLDKVRCAVAAELELDSLLRTTVEAVADTFGYALVSLYLLRGEALHLQHQVGYHQVIKTVPLECGVIGHVARSGEPALLEDVRSDPRFLGAVGGIVSEICVPFFDQGLVAGAINVETTHNVTLTGADLRLMTALGSQISVAVEKARLHARTKADLKRAHALYRVSQAVATSNTVAALLERVARDVATAVDADRVAAYALDVGRREVFAASVSASASTCPGAAPLEPLGFEALWAGSLGQALRERRTVSGPGGVDAALAVPLLFEDKPLGGLTLCKHRGAPDFDSDDRQLLEAIANQVAVAVEQRHLLDRLEHQAYHDTLTGLPNRLLFEDRLAQAVARSGRSGQPFALLFVDLDEFKHVNDTFGHHVGDGLLRQVAARLGGCLRQGDTLARMGGDEFALVLTDLGSADGVRVAQRYLELFKHPFCTEGHELFVTASIGACIYPKDGTDASVLLQHSDSAMYNAKTHGKNAVRGFTPELTQQARERRALERDLRFALERGELALYYQPQLELETCGVVGFEALLRWHHPERGAVPPSDFIPVAEASGLIVPIGAWVLREACRQNAAWQRAGRPPVRVAVNVSALQFTRADFIDTVLAALGESGLAPAFLELEVTESVVMFDLELVVERLQTLRELGVRVAVDDFGTGYSSLRYLQELPLDSLKIDRSFVGLVGSEGKPPALVGLIVKLAEVMALRVVAEGVETAVQLEYLRSLGCHEVQGYHVGKPQTGDKVWPTLQERLKELAG